MQQFPPGNILKRLFVGGGIIVQIHPPRLLQQAASLLLGRPRARPVLRPPRPALPLLQHPLPRHLRIAINRPLPNHDHHRRQESRDDQRIDDGEPVDPGAFFLVVEVHVPSVGPLDASVFAEVDGIGVGDCDGRAVVDVVLFGEVGREGVFGCEIGVVRCDVQLHALIDVSDVSGTAGFAPVSCSDAFGVDFETDNDFLTTCAGFARRLSPSEDESEVVINEVSWFTGGRREIFVTHFEPCRVVLLRSVHGHEACGSREIVNDPFGYVTILDELLGSFDSGSASLVATKVTAFFILAHDKVIVGRHDAIASQDLTEVKRDASPTG